MPRTRRTPKKDWKPDFLAALADTGMVSEACKAAHVGRSTVYDARQRDEQFALAWADVEEASTEELERVAVRRACEGSDVLLIFLLKARRPEKYRDNVHVQHSGHVDHDLKRMTAQELEQLADSLDAKRSRIRVGSWPTDEVPVDERGSA